MLLRCVLPLAILGCALHAEVLEFELKAGKSRPVAIASNADDSNFTEPRGYASHGTRSRSFIQRIELSNTGDKALTGRLLTIDERDFTSIPGLQRTLGLSADPARQARTMERLFTFWKDHRSHGGCGLALAYEPFATLNFWGYTLCGEDTQALARLAHAFEIPARFVQLNGHLAAEYRYDGGWHMVDGDQNAVYLKLDNQTLAGADDIRADPFLALRTKVFGRHSRQEVDVNAFNTSLIEHVAPAEPKPVKIKSDPAPLNTFTIHPGESLVWHCDTPPETPVGKLATEKPEVLRAAALATIEHRALAKHYKGVDSGSVTIASPFPIWKAVNLTTGAISAAKEEIAFRAAVPVKSGDDEIAVFSQCSRLALPLLHRGENSVKLDAKDGKARIAVHFEPAKKVVLPSAKLAAPAAAFTGPPTFQMTTSPRVDRVWWQVSASREFAFMAPSLEGVVPTSPELRFDALTDTFLSPNTAYFARIKARQENLWGEWSETVEFRVAKPAAPTNAEFQSAGGGFVRLAWKAPSKGVEFLVYASNRRDFIPEAFADTEIVAMNHTTVTEQRENKNLLVKTKELTHEFAPKHRFYRIISRGGGTLSVPGPLIVLPDDLAKDLPPARILQARASKEGNKDIYRVKEEPLTQPPAAGL